MFADEEVDNSRRRAAVELFPHVVERGFDDPSGAIRAYREISGRELDPDDVFGARPIEACGARRVDRTDVVPAFVEVLRERVEAGR